jgi:hypothetical protein
MKALANGRRARVRHPRKGGPIEGKLEQPHGSRASSSRRFAQVEALDRAEHPAPTLRVRARASPSSLASDATGIRGTRDCASAHPRARHGAAGAWLLGHQRAPRLV